jgi:Ca2+-binding EF-hand superfamily protein
LSSNMRSKASAEYVVETEQEIHLKRMLDFVWIRIQERFKNFSPAYRYFDLNFNNRVSFNEFSRALENLKVKMSTKDQMIVFKHLDADNKGYIDYSDFCNLSEERRLKLDPAQHMLKEYKEKGAL